MNNLLEPDELIFLSYEQELSWKKKWLEQKISILEKKLHSFNMFSQNQNDKSKNDQGIYECCSRTRPPPPSSPACIVLNPISHRFTCPSNLINSSFAPITPIWKTDDDSKYGILAANESDSDSYFKDDHPIVYDFTKEDNVNPSASVNSPSENKLPHDGSPQNSAKDSPGRHPKYIPQRSHAQTLIPTPEWTPCDPIMHSADENSSAIIDKLNSFETRCKKAHIEIEIIQRRIRKRKLNIPIEQSNIHDFNELSIFPTNKENKLERKYQNRPYVNQIPPNWEPRSYDNEVDVLNEKEVEIWKRLMKYELSKESINSDTLNRDLKLKHIQIRSSDEASSEINSTPDDV